MTDAAGIYVAVSCSRLLDCRQCSCADRHSLQQFFFLRWQGDRQGLLCAQSSPTDIDLFPTEPTILFSLLDAVLTGEQFGNVSTMNHSPIEAPTSQVVSVGLYGSMQCWS